MLRLGYDIGGMNVRVCLLDDQTFQIINQKTKDFPLGKGEEVFFKQLVKMANEISEPYGLVPENHLSIGIGIPGTIHHETGVLMSACNLNLTGISIVDRLHKHFPNAKIAIGNDADVAALAEYYVGVFQGYKSALLITIGTGIGGGLIINNRLFQGGLGFRSELGHIVLQQDGLMCSCGNRGCAETLCSASWLEREGRRSLIDHPMSRISILAQGKLENVRAKDIIEATKTGDGIARQIFEKYVDNLTALIVTCSYILGPEIVALGGGVSNAGDFLLEPLRHNVARRSRHYMPRKIVTAKLGNTAGMIGAAMLPCAVEEGVIKCYCL